MSDPAAARTANDEFVILPQPDQKIASQVPSAASPATMQVDVTAASSPLVPQTIFKRHRGPYKNGACTHLTMTRLYTKDYGCIMCYRRGEFGWLYRCTQDRELLVEHGLTLRHQECFDSVPEMLPEVSQSSKRGPAARAHRLSLLDEIGEQELATYTAVQLAQMLKQRSNVLDKAVADSDPGLRVDQGAHSTKITRPWLTLQENECQYRCCPRCRPNMVERSFLSLDGVANDDIPVTAVYGFGFHLQGFRPVADARIVADLGLRETHATRASTPEPSLTRPNPPARPKPRLAYSSNLRQAFRDGLGINRSSDNVPSLEPHTPSPSHRIPTPDELHSVPATGPENAIDAKNRTIAALDVSRLSIVEQSIGVKRPLTPQEEGEVEGRFGEEPLQVKNGVAVTEEALSLRVADVITQL